MRLAVRNDQTGVWDFTEVGKAKPAAPPVPRSTDFIHLDRVNNFVASEAVRSFVQVSCMMPVKLDGYPQARRTGFGLVIDAEKRLMIVFRAIVPYDLCDITITIADSIIVEGRAVFLHPLQNYTVVQYDPQLVHILIRAALLSKEIG
jgi:pro-apoptotic serine protease NMA111